MILISTLYIKRMLLLQLTQHTTHKQTDRVTYRDASHLKTLFRYQFIRDYTLKTLRLKLEKWNKLWIIDEQRSLITKFVETGGLGIIILLTKIPKI